MGVKQSKRSVDITETSTKGEIEGFGNEGKVEKIIDGVVEKVAANGHVEGDLQNGGESHQNGIEPVQNGEAAAVAAEKMMENKEGDESAAEGAVNGLIENCEINGEAEKTMEEQKKPEDKKEKKKEKKEKDKVVKKKFSFRNFSFSKKDKIKPPKEERTPEKVDKAAVEDTQNSEKPEEVTSPIENETVESPKVDSEKQEIIATNIITSIITEHPALEQPAVENVSEVSIVTSTAEDLPPPLPASPPPRQPEESSVAAKDEEDKVSGGAAESVTGEAKEIASAIANFLTGQTETSTVMIKDAEQIAMETGKQIEEKATNLLKTVEERAEESMRTAGEYVSQKTENVIEVVETVLGTVISGTTESTDAMAAEPPKDDISKKLEEASIPNIPLDISNLDTLTKAEEPAEKQEESGAGESLADIPKDLVEEVTAATIEATNPDSLEVSETLPPPVVEPATGE